MLRTAEIDRVHAHCVITIGDAELAEKFDQLWDTEKLEDLWRTVNPYGELHIKKVDPDGVFSALKYAMKASNAICAEGLADVILPGIRGKSLIARELEDTVAKCH